MIVYLKDKDILNEKIENEFDIKYNYQNTKLFKGTIADQYNKDYFASSYLSTIAILFP